MLRRALIVYGVLAIAGGLVLLALGVRFPLVLYLLVNGFVILAALLLERSRYRPEPPVGRAGRPPASASSTLQPGTRSRCATTARRERAITSTSVRRQRERSPKSVHISA
jgi:hypothetical protein